MNEKRVKKLIKNFVKCIDSSIKVSFNESVGHYFDFENDRVNIDLTDLASDGFIEHLNDTHKCKYAYKYTPLLWFILHEIGHRETQYEMDWQYDFRERFAFCLIKDEEIAKMEYYNIPSEFTATEWAIRWVKNNRFTIKIFNDKFKGLL